MTYEEEMKNKRFVHDFVRQVTTIDDQGEIRFASEAASRDI